MNDLLVLCYHGISRTWPAGESVKPEDLESQLEAFLEAGYRPATLDEALGSQLEGRTLVVTFDDAHRSVLELAAPAMSRLGVPGTVFVPTGYAGTERPMGWDGYHVWLGTEHEHELLCLGWEELRGLRESAGWEIGSHTRSHPRLSQIGDAEIEVELSESKRECEERIGAPCHSFAYPFSDYDARAVRAAAAAGYRQAVTVPRVTAPPLPLEWPRVGAFNGESARRLRLRAWSRRLGPAPPARAALALRRVLP
jgi:peptidoglycan/xylan/chitin deacetylase (PgdA/CDA1 family)